MQVQVPGRGIDAFVDRAAEQKLLQEGIDEFVKGRGSFFTISGEAGVGKSRLSREAAVYASECRVSTLWGRCWEHGGAPAYRPWTQVLRGLVGGLGLSTLRSWLGAGASDVAQIAPELRDQLGEPPAPPLAELAQPDMARFRLHNSVVSLLRNAARTRPLLIILDDLHVGDAASLMLLVAVAREVRSMRATIIGAYREVELGQSPERAKLLSAAEREGRVFPLRGLQSDDIREFVERGWGVSAAVPLVDQLLKLTDGNPFFLHEVVRRLASEDRLHNAAAIDTRFGVTRGLRDFIRALAEPLPTDARSVLDVASVIGPEFSMKVLAAATEEREERLIEHLDQARSLGLIEGGPARYSFRHALIREALYEAMEAGVRRRLHRAIAEAIEPSKAAAEIAYHYCKVESPDSSDLAIRYSRMAAEQAENQLAYEEAAGHLRNAIEALELKREADDEIRADLLCDLGRAEVKMGNFGQARKTCLHAADCARQGQPETFARAVVIAGRGVSNSGVTDHELVLLLGEALERLDDRDGALRAQLLARLGIELYWSERERAVALCQQAVEMARSVGDPHAMIVALWGRHISLRNPDSLAQRLADGKETIALAEAERERDFALEARYFHIADLVEFGDIDGFDAALRDYLSEEDRLHDRFKRGLLLQCMRALMDARLHDAEDLAQQAFVAGQQSGRPLALNAFLIQRGYLLRELGRLAELVGPASAYVAANPLIVFARCGLMTALIQDGRMDDARAELESLAENEFQRVPRDWNWLPSMYTLSEVCADLGDAKHAETIYLLLAPYASHNAVVGYVAAYGPITFALGRLAALLNRHDEAEAFFETAIAMSRRLRAALWLADAQCELVAVLRTRDRETDRGRAQALLASAKATAESLNLPRLTKKLEKFAPRADGSHPSAEESIPAAAPTARAEDHAADRDRLDALAAAVGSLTRNLSAFASFERTVTILFSDIEDSSRLYEKYGDLRAHEAIHLHNEIFRRQIAAHGGQEIKSLGDGFMIVFSSAHQAVRCAIALQKAFATYRDCHPDMPLQVRIGLHVGEAISNSSDLFGRAVNFAARVTAAARGGQILASATLRDLTASAGDLHFASAGEKKFKGFSGRHAVFEVVW